MISKILVINILLIFLTFNGLSQNLQIKYSELKGIELSNSKTSIKIVYKFNVKISKCVVEKKNVNTIQLRMKSVLMNNNIVKLLSNRNNIKSVKTRIERKDVLVSDIVFNYKIENYHLTRNQATIILNVNPSNNLSNNNSLDKNKIENKKICKIDHKKSDSKIVTKVIKVDKTNSISEKSVTDKVKISNTKSKGTKTNSKDNQNLKKDETKIDIANLKLKGNYTIVIDPGHGGEDPGTISDEDLTMEKNVTLSVGKKLVRELTQMIPNGKIIITRDDDTYISLLERSRIANRNNAKLFVSLHCNSAVESPEDAHGFECYIFREKLESSSKDITSAEFIENKSYGMDMLFSKSFLFTTEKRKVDIADEAFSWQLANWIVKSMAKGTSIKNRGIQKAHFYVLGGTLMPAVLVEMGYLTNLKDRVLMNSKTGQNKIAKSVAIGVCNYLKNLKK
jgi:N-acetylmuramoyl-L-alanine amidase